MSLFFLYGQRFQTVFKIAVFGHETWPLAKVPKVAHRLSLYPKGSKLSLFSLYWQRFLRYWPIFKIVIFGHETWSLTKVNTFFLPHGVEIELIFALWAEVSEI